MYRIMKEVLDILLYDTASLVMPSPKWPENFRNIVADGSKRTSVWGLPPLASLRFYFIYIRHPQTTQQTREPLTL